MSFEQRKLFEPEPSWTLSECGRYRYTLEYPTYLPHGKNSMALFVLANPSDATPVKPDPTAGRCIQYARTWGFGWAGIVNVRAWIETDPKKLPEDALAVGPDNEKHVRSMIQRADLVVCGWGKLGGTLGLEMLRFIRSNGKVPHSLALNLDGSPRHPLYLLGTLRPQPMPEIYR